MKIYTIAEIAKLLRTNKACVYKCIHEGKLKAFKIGTYKVTEESFLEFIKNAEKEAV